MKPMRGLPGSWLNNLPKERRAALVSLAVLLALLGSLVLYQRFTMLSHEIPIPDPGPDLPVEKGTKVEQTPPVMQELPVASGSETATAAPRPVPTKLERPLAGTPQLRMKFDDIHKAFGDMRLYSALAFAAKPGDSVLAAGPGTVAEILDSPIDGRVVLIDHGNDLMTRYAGMGKPLVAKGAAVTTGAILGQVGEPGAVWSHLGAHLQFQVLVKGEPVNPLSYFLN